MQTFKNHAQYRAQRQPSAVAIGIFDGVHWGHQALLGRAVQCAQSSRLQSLAFTFDPHPARVLSPDLAPQLIEPVTTRLSRFAALGLHAALVQPFDRDFAATSAEDFVREVLVGSLDARHVIVGAGFTFGRRQSGHVALLQQMGAEFGFEVHAVEHVRKNGIEVSSTKVREFVHTGQLNGATLLLGRFFALYGTVEHGAHRGATLGFPTANLRPQNELWPANGVYGGHAHTPHGSYRCVMNVGTAPTFAGAAGVKVEVHLLDYPGASLYHCDLSVDFHERLRDEMRFDGVEALRAQITADVAQARQRIAPV